MCSTPYTLMGLILHTAHHQLIISYLFITCIARLNREIPKSCSLLIAEYLAWQKEGPY